LAFRKSREAKLDKLKVARVGSMHPEMPEKSFRILVVEDNTFNQKVILHQLRQIGYEADVAVHGLEALHYLEQWPYDLILMDCHLPILDGFQTTRRIREQEWRWQVVIIGFTASGGRADVLAAGMDDYLPKPATREQLKAALDRWRWFFRDR
jgi:CheY-like chemotaxis protein